MKVIKHGDRCQDFSVPARLECLECGCEFEYEQTDIKPTISQTYKRYYGIVFCPECGKSHTVRCNQDYWEESTRKIADIFLEENRKLVNSKGESND